MYIISIKVRLRRYSERRVYVFRHPGHLETPLLRRPFIRRSPDAERIHAAWATTLALIPALPADGPASHRGPPTSDPVLIDG